MTELKRLSVKVPIKFSERAQRDLYETCMAYKELAEVRGEENEKLRKMAEKYVRQAYALACEKGNPITKDIIMEDARELGMEVE